MIFKRGKYNLIFILMLMLVIGVCGYEVYQQMTMPAVDITKPSDPNGSDGTIDDGGSGDEDNNGDQEEEPPQQEDKDNFISKNRRFAAKIVNYTLDKLYNGNGYKSTYQKTMTNTANILGGVKVTQNISGTIDKSGTQSLEKLTFKAEGSMSDMGVNLIRAFYFNGDQVTQYQTGKGQNQESDFANATQTNMSKTDYYNKYILSLAEKPIFTFSSAKAISSGTKNGRKYTVIQAQVDVASMNQYTKYYESSGDLTNVKAISAQYTFYIYEDTAQIFQIQGNETLTGKNPAFGVDVDVQVKTSQTFTSVNKEFEIAKP